MLSCITAMIYLNINDSIYLRKLIRIRRFNTTLNNNYFNALKKLYQIHIANYF